MTELMEKLKNGKVLLWDDGAKKRTSVTAARNAADVIETLQSETNELKSFVVAFGAPWAVQYAKDFGLPKGHLHPTHYDILEKCGARMDDFARA